MKFLKKVKIFFSHVWDFAKDILAFFAKYTSPDDWEMAIMVVGALTSKDLPNATKKTIALKTIMKFLKSKKVIGDNIKENPISAMIEIALNNIKNGKKIDAKILDIISKRLMNVIKDRSVDAVKRELAKNGGKFSYAKVKELIELAKHYNDAIAEETTDAN